MTPHSVFSEESEYPSSPMDRVACGLADETELRAMSDGDLCNGVTLLLLTPGCIAYRSAISRLICWYTDECSVKADAARLIGELEQKLAHRTVMPYQRAAVCELIRRLRLKTGI